MGGVWEGHQGWGTYPMGWDVASYDVLDFTCKSVFFLIKKKMLDGLIYIKSIGLQAMITSANHLPNLNPTNWRDHESAPLSTLLSYLITPNTRGDALGEHS